MKILLASTLVLFATQASAENVKATVTDHYRNETVSTPIRTNECINVEVPIYGQKQSTTGDAVAGAIIGGLIGNQFGSGDGKDAMTVLGAIAGADVARNTGSRIVGYRTERQCSEVVRYKENVIRSYSHSTATFTVDNKRYSVDFIK